MRPAQTAAGIDTSGRVMPDFAAALQRPPHPLVTRLEASVAALLSSGSEAAALHGELARIAAARAGLQSAREGATPRDPGGSSDSGGGGGADEAGVVGSRDSVLADSINAVFGGLTML